MPQKNQVSLQIPENDLAEIKAAVATLKTKLEPFLKTLSKQERHDLPKMGDKSVPFVQKTLEHCRQNPDLIPRFLDINEFEKDVRTVELLNSFYRQLEQTVSQLDDTIKLAGSEAYKAALLFYNSAKTAKKANTGNAKTVYKDLSVRFPGRPKKEKKE